MAAAHEKAKYEAQRAERQYMTVEPENRTVARELERRWNARLQELETIRAQAAHASRGRRLLTDDELARAHQLGNHLEAVWQAPTTTARDRKRLLRTIIDEVQLTTDDKHHHVRIVWKGGAVTDRHIVRFRPGDAAKVSATAEEIIELSYRLSLRTAQFVGTDHNGRKDVFDAVREGYGLRSKIVHGAAETADDHALQERLEQVVFRALRLYCEKVATRPGDSAHKAIVKELDGFLLERRGDSG